MATAGTPSCAICADPFRHKVEDAYLQGDMATVRLHRYTRQEVDAHMGHVTDPEVLRLVSGLSSATAVAARMRQLEQASSAILELAIQQEDGRLALMALREARQTLVEISKLADALDGQQSSSVERQDLDDAIADYLGAKRVDDSTSRGARTPTERELRELPSGDVKRLMIEAPDSAMGEGGQGA